MVGISRHHILTTAAVLLTITTVGAQGPQTTTMGPADAAALRAKGIELGYNLDHAAALDAFTAAIAAAPDHPAAYRLVAATMWINVLFRQGAVTAEDFLGQAGESAAPRPRAADIDRRFRESLDKAITLAETELQHAGPKSADAHYQLGAAYGFLATYTATIEGSLTSALGPSRRAYREHSRVLELDPSRTDAGLIVGLYRYAVSILPWWSRVLANLAGFDGGRDEGIRLVEAAAARPSDVQTNARFALIVIYNREQRYADALRVIAALQRQYPRNRLLWLEAGSTSLRAGRPSDANTALEEGLAKLGSDPRPRAYGELARWRYHHGVALAGVGRTDAARLELNAAVAAEGHQWLHGRAHLELGRIALKAGDRSTAAAELRSAASLCEAAKDAACLRDTRAEMRRTR